MADHRSKGAIPQMDLDNPRGNVIFIPVLVLLQAWSIRTKVINFLNLVVVSRSILAVLGGTFDG